MKNTAPALAGRDRCTGCSLCAEVCPAGCIEMQRDAEGFLHPRVGEGCVGCSKCERACPVLSDGSLRGGTGEQQACCAIHRDEKVWSRSSSGGAFTAVCEIWGDADTVIFGAAFDGGSRTVRHRAAAGAGSAQVFSGSKYVQSDMGDALKELRQCLERRQRVIFSGTPCQVAAVRSLLGNGEQKDVLCVDLLCHGVGSPGVFGEFLARSEREQGKAIADVQFRNKRIRLGVHRLYRTGFRYSDGTAGGGDDWYRDLFLRKMICRRSCSDCIYAGEKRCGDLTIGDFKHMYSVVPGAPANRNGSVVICNTPMGRGVFERLGERMDVYPCTTGDVRRTNVPFSRPAPTSPDRERFFGDFAAMPFEELYRKYRFRRSLKSRLAGCIPEKLKARLKRALKRQSR